MNSKSFSNINDEGFTSSCEDLKSNQYINDDGEICSLNKNIDDLDDFPIYGTINNLYSGL